MCWSGPPGTPGGNLKTKGALQNIIILELANELRKTILLYGIDGLQRHVMYTYGTMTDEELLSRICVPPVADLYVTPLERVGTILLRNWETLD